MTEAEEVVILVAKRIICSIVSEMSLGEIRAKEMRVLSPPL
jgi:hypothetical protein